MAQSSIRRFYRELKRRKVIRVAIVYTIVVWLVVEVASVMFPGLLLPEWSVRLVIALAIIGFPIALVLAWAVELTPEGIKADTGVSKDTARKSSLRRYPFGKIASKKMTDQKMMGEGRLLCCLF